MIMLLLPTTTRNCSRGGGLDHGCSDHGRENDHDYDYNCDHDFCRGDQRGHNYDLAIDFSTTEQGPCRPTDRAYIDAMAALPGTVLMSLAAVSS